MAKRSQGWVKCEDPLPYYRDSSCSLPLPRRLHDHNHNSATREDLAAGAAAPGVKGPLEWALGASMQREGAVPGSFVQKK
jgi:hypothetical protein